MNKVNTTCVNGDNVYFKCGSMWAAQQLWIDWSGTAGSKVTIGAYHGNGVIGVSGNKPLFDGNNTTPVLGSFDGLVHVSSSAKYVIVRNLRVIESGGNGIMVDGVTPTMVNGVDVLTCDTYWTYRSGIRYVDCNTGLIEGNTTEQASQLTSTGQALGGTDSVNLTIRNNKVFKNNQEGIGLYHGCNNNIIENNECFANQAVAIFIDSGQNNTIRNNLVYGTTDPVFGYQGSGASGPGIKINDETFNGTMSEGNLIYNNLVAFCAKGIWLVTADPNSVLRDTLVYNNTIVDCNVQIEVPNGPFENSFIVNNIFWAITPGMTNYAGYSTPDPGLVWLNNNWKTAPGAPASGTGDVIGAANLSKSSGWRSITTLGGLVAANFDPTASTPGTNLGNTGIAGNNLDYYGSNLRQMDPDIGAIERVAAAPLTVQFETATVAANTDSYAIRTSPADVLFQANAVSDSITFSVPNVQAGTYSIAVVVQKGSNRGTFQLESSTSLGGTYTAHGSPQDTYNAAFVSQTLSVASGVTFSTTGTRYFRFRITGKNASSNGYYVALDSMTLTP